MTSHDIDKVKSLLLFQGFSIHFRDILYYFWLDAIYEASIHIPSVAIVVKLLSILFKSVTISIILVCGYIFRLSSQIRVKIFFQFQTETH